MQIREGIQMSDEDAAEYDLCLQQAEYYDRLQYVYKIKLNSLYGALTNMFFRFFDLRLGESTTATGRNILKHQCRQVNLELTGKYDIEFPLYENIKEAAESGQPASVALDGPVFNGKFQTDCIIYGDTDSTYFNTFASNKEEAIEIADTVAKLVNDSFPEFMRNNFLCQPSFDTLIQTGREIISRNGIFVDKKRYILNIVDKEGKSCDNLKVMGLDTIKTTLPPVIGKRLNNFVGDYLRGKDWKDVAKEIVDYKQQLRSSKNPLDVGLPKGVKNVEKYTTDYDIDVTARLPGHVAASIHFNKCLEQFNDKSTTPIISGMKIKVFYLTKQYGKFKSIALPTDIEVIPQWFYDNFEIDFNAQILRLVDKPLENIIRAIGKKSPTPRDILIEDAFEF